MALIWSQIANSAYAQNTHSMIQKGLTKAVIDEKLLVTASGIIGRGWLKSLADGFLLCIYYVNEWRESVETMESRNFWKENKNWKSDSKENECLSTNSLAKTLFE